MTHLCLILGWPLGHTLSPAMHNAAFRALGLDWRYEARPTPPEDLPRAVAELRAGQVAGANVTVPHKETIVPLLDDLDPTARGLGAVNTVVNAGGTLVGHNTDAGGFLADLRALGIETGRGPALILGAGGAARAVAFALAASGIEIRLTARTLARARRLAADLASAVISTHGWTLDEIARAVEGCSLIVNATPVGMSPQTDLSPWPDSLPFPPDAIIYDLIYNPPETGLMRQARTAGLRAENGLGMLAAQGAAAFKLWTGLEAPQNVMLRAIAR